VKCSCRHLSNCACTTTRIVSFHSTNHRFPVTTQYRGRWWSSGKSRLWLDKCFLLTTIFMAPIIKCRGHYVMAYASVASVSVLTFGFRQLEDKRLGRLIRFFYGLLGVPRGGFLSMISSAAHPRWPLRPPSWIWFPSFTEQTPGSVDPIFMWLIGGDQRKGPFDDKLRVWQHVVGL
jgi:hypothetical protein